MRLHRYMYNVIKVSNVNYVVMLNRPKVMFLSTVYSWEQEKTVKKEFFTFGSYNTMDQMCLA